MSALDIALSVILSYFFIRGIFRGLVKEIVGILGLFVAFWAASAYWRAGAEQLRPVIDNDIYRSVLSFVIIYLIIYFLIGLMSLFVDKIVKVTITPLCSGLTGGVLGVIKGAALSIVLLTAATAFIKPDMPFYTESAAWTKIAPLCEQVKTWVPETLRRLMNQRGPVVSGDLRGAQPPAAAVPPARPSPGRVAPGQGPAGAPAPPTDFASLKALVENFADRVSPAWRERVASLLPEQVDSELLRQFVQDNRALFVSVRTEPAPAWPRPAQE
ncbi:MAG: CvpA family protein [Deltaproteobacteria bacterium]|jgi:membrane protein required for colicin V production|nr:CvpA family protein [Deltaproteobacteria bacterium]